MPLKDLAGVARMAAELPNELQRAQLRGVRKGALSVTRSIRSQIRSVTGDNRLSGVGRRGGRVGARYDVKGVANPVAIVRATGPLQLVEHPTGAHAIAPRAKRGERSALRLRDGSLRARVTHPGTQPSRPFERGYLASRDEPGKALDAEVQRAIRKVLL